MSARIARVKPKAGGDIHILPTEPRTETQQGLLEATLYIIGEDPDMTGFVVLTWDEYGNPYCQTWNSEDSPLCDEMIPAFVQTTTFAQLFCEDEYE